MQIVKADWDILFKQTPTRWLNRVKILEKSSRSLKLVNRTNNDNRAISHFAWNDRGTDLLFACHVWRILSWEIIQSSSLLLLLVFTLAHSTPLSTSHHPQPTNQPTNNNPRAFAFNFTIFFFIFLFLHHRLRHRESVSNSPSPTSCFHFLSSLIFFVQQFNFKWSVKVT